VLSETGAGSFGESLYRLDLKAAKRRLLGSYNEARGVVTSFFVTRGGAVAWSLDDKFGDGDDRVDEIWREGTGGRELLESSPAVEADSLALSDNRRRVYWTSGGQPRSADLR
jgi:hypothetical protein